MNTPQLTTFDSLIDAPWGDGDPAKIARIEYELVIDPAQPDASRKSVQHDILNARVGRSGTSIVYPRPIDRHGNTVDEVISIRFQIGNLRKTTWSVDPRNEQLLFQGALYVMPEDIESAEAVAHQWLEEAQEKLLTLVKSLS